MTLAPTRIADRYLLLEQIGAGALATVWRGFDTRLRRPIAIKLLRGGATADPEVARRFEAGARQAATLSHPNVATVFDSGRDGDGRFIVMELADGPSVSDRLHDRGPLPPVTAVEIAASAARALAAAHRRGLVHGNVTTRNLLLRRDGRVLLSDFALAASAGTSPADDVAALASVLDEMLTGPVPGTAGAGLPAGLDRILGRALGPDPSRRYRTANGFVRALSAWLRRAGSTPGDEGRDVELAVVARAPVIPMEVAVDLEDEAVVRWAVAPSAPPPSPAPRPSLFGPSWSSPAQPGPTAAHRQRLVAALVVASFVLSVPLVLLTLLSIVGEPAPSSVPGDGTRADSGEPSRTARWAAIEVRWVGPA